VSPSQPFSHQFYFFFAHLSTNVFFLFVPNRGRFCLPGFKFLWTLSNSRFYPSLCKICIYSPKDLAGFFYFYFFLPSDSSLSKWTPMADVEFTLTAGNIARCNFLCEPLPNLPAFFLLYAAGFASRCLAFRVSRLANPSVPYLKWFFAETAFFFFLDRSGCRSHFAPWMVSFFYTTWVWLGSPWHPSSLPFAQWILLPTAYELLSTVWPVMLFHPPQRFVVSFDFLVHMERQALFFALNHTLETFFSIHVLAFSPYAVSTVAHTGKFPWGWIPSHIFVYLGLPFSFASLIFSTFLLPPLAWTTEFCWGLLFTVFFFQDSHYAPCPFPITFYFFHVTNHFRPLLFTPLTLHFLLLLPSVSLAHVSFEPLTCPWRKSFRVNLVRLSAPISKWT